MNNKERFARIAAVTSIIGLSATASSCDWVDWNLKHERIVPQGTTVRVQPDQFIEGNVTLKSADGTWTTVLFDKDEKTGLIVNPEITSEVTFAEEGKIVRVTNLKNKDAEIEKEKQKMIKAKGYTKVDAITVDGGIQQMQGENLPGRSID